MGLRAQKHTKKNTINMKNNNKKTHNTKLSLSKLNLEREALPSL